MTAKTIRNSTTSLSFVHRGPDGYNPWHVPTPQAFSDGPFGGAYGDGCTKGDELAIEYLSQLRQEPPEQCGCNMIGQYLSAMPWDAFHAPYTERTPEQDYQSGVMVGFFSMLQRFIRAGVNFVDPQKYFEEYNRFYATRKAEMEAEMNSSRRKAARKGWKTRRAAA